MEMEPSPLTSVSRNRSMTRVRFLASFALKPSSSGFAGDGRRRAGWRSLLADVARLPVFSLAAVGAVDGGLTFFDAAARFGALDGAALLGATTLFGSVAR